MKKIRIYTTGGTIASTEGENGLLPTMTGDDMLNLVPECRTFGEISCRAIMNLDSTNIQPEDWTNVATALKEEVSEFDGFVVLHGTDTMAYSAAAVAFMTIGIQKPVIYTGSQIPISKPGTDAMRNIRDAVFAAANLDYPGIYIAFNGKLMNGCSVSKTNTFALDAFSSVNTCDVGEIDGLTKTLTINYQPNRLVDRYRWHTNVENKVLLLKLYPGVLPETIRYEFVRQFKAVILEAFGAGGVPAYERSFLPKIRELQEHGILTVITSQCLQGASDISIYEVGKNAAELGAVCAGPIVSDVLVAKLMWAVSMTSDLSELKDILSTDFCGEFGDQ